MRSTQKLQTFLRPRRTGRAGREPSFFSTSHCWFTSCLNFCVGMDALERQIVAVVDDGKVIGIPGRIAGDRLDVGRAGGGLGVLAGLAAIRGAAPHCCRWSFWARQN